MFEDKFRKQFVKMFPLEEQEGEQQSANPSLNKNSNEDESEDGRVTPHYNVYEEDQQKPVQRFDIWYENSHAFEDNLQKTNQQGENNYQIMRQNAQINYETFFNRKIPFENKEKNSQLDQTKQIIVVTAESGVRQEQYDFSPVNSSFQHLMDSNFKGKQYVEKKKVQVIDRPIVYVEYKKPETNEQSYAEVTINGQSLSNEMLLDPGIRWRLVFELLDLQTPQNSIKFSGLPQALEKVQLKHNDQKYVFNSVSETVEQKLNLIESLVENSLEKQIDQREKKEFLALYKYQQSKNSLFLKFQENSQKSIQTLQESIGKRFQKTNLQLMRAKRVLTHSIDTCMRQQLKEEDKIEKQMHQLKKSHNQSLQKLQTQLQGKFTKAEDEITEVKKQIKHKNYMIEESLEKLTTRVTGYLQKEIAEGKQIESDLAKLLLALIENLE